MGICCFCGYSGEEETECLESYDDGHCRCWYEGPDCSDGLEHDQVRDEWAEWASNRIKELERQAAAWEEFKRRAEAQEFWGERLVIRPPMNGRGWRIYREAGCVQEANTLEELFIEENILEP